MLRIFVLNPHRSIDIFGGRVFYMYIYGFSICIYMMFYIIVIWPIHHYSVILLIIKSYSASVRNLSNHVNLVSYVFQFIATIVFTRTGIKAKFKYEEKR